MNKEIHSSDSYCLVSEQGKTILPKEGLRFLNRVRQYFPKKDSGFLAGQDNTSQRRTQASEQSKTILPKKKDSGFPTKTNQRRGKNAKLR